MTRAATDLEETGGTRRAVLADYAAMYGADPRTVKRWRATGRANGDEPPFEDPEAMMAWAQRNIKIRIPPGIQAAVVKWRKEGKSPVAAVSVPEQKEIPLADAGKLAPRDDERAAVLSVPVSEEEMGLPQTLRRLNELEVKLARVATDPGQTKAWLDTVQRMGAVVKSLREEGEKQGKLIPRDRAEVMIHEFHVPVEREIRIMVREMGEILGIPVTPMVEQAWNKLCDRMFTRFGEEVFRAS